MKNFTTNLTNVNFEMETLTIQDMRNKLNKKVVVKTKSEMFRIMYDYNMEICEIAKQTESHYSFVYGVISASREVREIVKTSKSDEIRKMFDDGKTPGEISKLLNSNYSFVFSVVKKYKNSKIDVTAAV